MKNTFRLIGIIALLAIIGFSMAACSDDNGGSADVSIHRTAYNNVVKISNIPGYNVLASDFTVTINGTAAYVLGAGVKGGKFITLNISAPLVVGQRYNVKVEYNAGSGKIASVAAKFPYSNTLVCKAQDW